MEGILSFDEFNLNESRDEQLDYASLYGEDAIVHQIGEIGHAAYQPNLQKITFGFKDKYDKEIKASHVLDGVDEDDLNTIVKAINEKNPKLEFRYESGAKAELKALQEILYDLDYMSGAGLVSILHKLGAWQKDGVWHSKETVRLDEYPNAAKNGKLLVKFGRVEGGFLCDGMDLTTLEGCPEYVGDFFYCQHNKLTDLKGGPKVVKGAYNANGCELTSLEGAPEIVGKDFYVSENKLTSLVGGPRRVEGGVYDAQRNQLTDLEGCPEHVHYDLDLQNNQITTFKGLKHSIQRLDVAYNELKSFHNLPDEMFSLNVGHNQISSMKGAPKKIQNLTGMKKNVPEIEYKWYKSIAEISKDNPEPPGYENYHKELFAHIVDKFSDMIKDIKWGDDIDELDEINLKTLIQSDEMIKKFKL